MTRVLLVSILFASLTVSAQQSADKLLLSEALNANIKKYNAKADRAIQFGDYEFAKSLFDSLVHNHLQGSYLDRLTFEGYKNHLTSTDDFDKPTVILTYSSWCIPNAGEIPALNKLAQQYGELMDFVVLYWDSKSEVRKQARKFDKQIKVIYVDETQNKHMKTVQLLKHSLGLSLAYVVSASGEVLDINRRPPNSLNVTKEVALANNLSFISEQVATIYLDLNINIQELPESMASF